MLASHVETVRKNGRIVAIVVTLSDGTLYRVTRLLSDERANPKISKSAKKFGARYMSRILHLAAHNASGFNVCPWARGCAAVCLGPHSGHGRMSSTQRARAAKTVAFMLARADFLEMLTRELVNFARLAKRAGKIPCVRLNGTSDVRWYRVAPELWDIDDSIVFYDYTKDPKRFEHVQALGLKYHTTFSRDEKNHDSAWWTVWNGGTAAVVFRTRDMLQTAIENGFCGIAVTNADEHDLRFLDRPGTWSGLYAKGGAAQDTSGFVVDIDAHGAPIGYSASICEAV